MRLSPVTVPYRVFQRASSVLIVAFIAAGSDMARVVGGPAVVAGLVTVAVLALVVYEIAYYRRFEYEFTHDTLDIRSGVFGRRERELPYHRIQNVDVTRNAIPRVLGIAAVAFETAGGSQTEGSIRYVSGTEADRLQREIQRRKQAADGTDDDAPAEEELFALAPHELGLVGALSFDARVLGLLTLVGPGSVPFFSGALSRPPVESAATAGLLVAGLGLAAWLLGIAVAVVNYYRFRLSRVEDELRYERGLFRRYSGSVPESKVQSITVEDNPLKRAFGYATLTVETAGYSPGSSGGSEVAVPIARRERVHALASEVEAFDDPTFERPPGRIRRRYAVRYLIAVGLLAAAAYAVTRHLRAGLPWYGVGTLLLAVVPAAHLKWRHRGYWAGGDHVVLRNGFWSRSMTAVPYYRVQTVIDSRTIFQRRWDVATVTVDTAGSSSLFGRGAAAVDVAIPEAVELQETLTERLQDALAERRRKLRSGEDGS